MHKVVYYNRYGGYGSFPKELIEEMAKRKGISYDDARMGLSGYGDHEIQRHDTDLVELVEKYKLPNYSIHEIEGNAYIIDEYDGLERVIEPKDIRWIKID